MQLVLNYRIIAPMQPERLRKRHDRIVRQEDFDGNVDLSPPKFDGDMLEEDGTIQLTEEQMELILSER